MGREEDDRLDAEENGEFVASREVREQALRLLVEAGYELQEGAEDPEWDPAMQSSERPLALKRLDGDISIRVTERPPTPSLRLWLIAERVDEDPESPWSELVHLEKVKRFSYRIPARAKKTLAVVEAALIERASKTCPHCGGPMANRKVRNPKSKFKDRMFLGCIRYPKCRGTIADWMPRSAADDGKLVGAACPDCGEDLVIRYCKQEHLPHRGSSFIGCSGFPKCRRIVTKEELTALRLIGPEKNEVDLEDIF